MSWFHVKWKISGEYFLEKIMLLIIKHHKYIHLLHEAMNEDNFVTVIWLWVRIISEEINSSIYGHDFKL